MIKKEYTITFENGTTLIFHVPEKWRVTMGPLMPGKIAHKMAVRVYAGNKLKGLFPNAVYLKANEIDVVGDVGHILPQPGVLPTSVGNGHIATYQYVGTTGGTGTWQP